MPDGKDIPKPDSLEEVSKNLRPDLDTLDGNLSYALSQGYIRRDEQGRLAADTPEGEAFIQKYRNKLGKATAREDFSPKDIEEDKDLPHNIEDLIEGADIPEVQTQGGIMPQETPGPDIKSLRESPTGEDFRSVGQISEQEKIDAAADLGTTPENVADMVRTRNNSTGQLASHGAEVVDHGNGDFGLKLTDRQIENAQKQMERERAKDWAEGKVADIKDSFAGRAELGLTDVPKLDDPPQAPDLSFHEAPEAVIPPATPETVEPYPPLATPATETETAEARAWAQSKVAEIKQDFYDKAAENSAPTSESGVAVDKNLAELQDLNHQTEEIRASEIGEVEPELEARLADIERRQEEIMTTVERIAVMLDNIAKSRLVQAGGEKEKLTEKTAEEKFTDASDKYLQLLAQRRRWTGKRGVSEAELAEARADYERSLTDICITRAEQIADEKFPELKGVEREEMITKQASAEMVFEYFKRCEAESGIENRSWPRVAFNWIKQHPRIRFVTGLTLTGVAFASMAVGCIPLTVACVSGRAILGGVGTGVATEGGLDWLQRRTDARLHGVTPEQISQMSPEEAAQVMAAERAFLVRRGLNVEGSQYSEQIQTTLVGIENDTKARMTELLEKGDSSDMARGRALTEAINNMNIASESADQNERSKSITRAVGASVVGLLAGGGSLYAGLQSLAPRFVKLDQVPGSHVPKPEIHVPKPAVDQLNGLNHNATAKAGEHIWGITEEHLKQMSSRLGLRLNHNQMEAAIDRGKDWYVGHGYGSGPKHWLYRGNKLPINGKQLEQWLQYGLEHPKR